METKMNEENEKPKFSAVWKNNPQSEPRTLANWQDTAGELLEGNSLEKVLDAVVATAREHRKAGGVVLFDVWERLEGGWVTKAAKGFVNEQGEAYFQPKDPTGGKVTLAGAVHLDNGKEYEGSVYFLEGMHETDTAGTLYAFCNAETWGIGCGTCLAPLYDEQGKRIIKPEHRGEGGRLKGLEITLHND